jgi:hypothetical protein
MKVLDPSGPGAGMPVKVTVGEPVYSLTSPPKQANPAPPIELIAKTMEYEDRKVLVTIPFPDTIELTADILQDLLENPDTSYKSDKQKYQVLDSEIGAMLGELAYGGPEGTAIKTLKKATELVLLVPYDPGQPLNRATLSLWRTKSVDFDYGSWSVKLEFSASKAGPAGHVKLISAITDILWFLKMDRLLAAFRVLRVDPAIDLIGANPLDLIAHVPKPGKRLVYVGADGHPESIYLYEFKPLPTKPPASLSSKGTLGTLRLKLYERRAYHRQLGLEPPYGPCPVTRAELLMAWKKKQYRPFLTDLGGIKNLFANRRVAYAMAAWKKGTTSKKDWVRFCMAAFGAGIESAQISWHHSSGWRSRTQYLKCAGDLIDETSWARWEDGIAYTGLGEWIKIAQSAK